MDKQTNLDNQLESLKKKNAVIILDNLLPSMDVELYNVDDSKILNES